MYAILLASVAYISWIERQDWESSPHSKIEECNGNGMPHRNSKPLPNDNCAELLQRIENGAGAERKSIKWRRALMLSTGSMLVLWFLLLTPGRLPEWTKFYMSVIIVFVIIRAQFAWYSYHRFKIPEEYIYEAVNGLKKCIQ